MRQKLQLSQKLSAGKEAEIFFSRENLQDYNNLQKEQKYKKD